MYQVLLELVQVILSTTRKGLKIVFFYTPFSKELGKLLTAQKKAEYQVVTQINSFLKYCFPTH